MAHLHPDGICPYGKLNASITNPFTGKKIALGTPYYYEDVPYFSLNLASKALTAYDGTGVQLELDNTGGAFSACSTGDSSMLKLEEKFAFTYPKGLFSLRDNTLFETADGELSLLCHTEKSGLDDISCYAYISFDTVREYMLKDGYFTDFIDNGLGVWSFIVRRPSVYITFPDQSTPPFKVGDTITVKANIGNADSAKLIIGQYTEAANTLISEREVVFDAYTFTEADAGNVTIKIECQYTGVQSLAFKAKPLGQPPHQNQQLKYGSEYY